MVIFGFVLIVGVIVIAYMHASSFSEQVTNSQAQKIGNQVIDAVNAVFYQGPPAKRTITVYFPDNIKNVTVENQSIVFTLSTSAGYSEYAISAATNMTGSIRNFAGLHVMTLEAYDAGTTVEVNVTDS